jgi:hypothetical protein
MFYFTRKNGIIWHGLYDLRTHCAFSLTVNTVRSVHRRQRQPGRLWDVVTLSIRWGHLAGERNYLRGGTLLPFAGLYTLPILYCGPGWRSWYHQSSSIVGIATCYGLDGPGIESRWGGGEIFRTRPDRPWGPTSHLYNGYRVFFPGVKRPGRGVDHPPHLASRLKKE